MIEGSVKGSALPDGTFLACKTEITGDLTINIPTTMDAAARKSTLHADTSTALKVGIKKLFVSLPKPSIEDQCQDWERLLACLPGGIKVFEDIQQRDHYYQILDKELVTTNKANLLQLKNSGFRPLICQIESKLIEKLTGINFVQVTTPIILAKGMLEKMTITPEYPLTKQVFWLDKNKCLRPMLAPNLYFLLKDLVRLWGKPVRIFEIGPCFRKESQGAQHLNEFTMLNLVELGVPEGQQKERLKQLMDAIMDSASIKNYNLETCESEVYGETIDVVLDDLELGSGAFGPHSLDENWGIFYSWVDQF